MRFDAQPQYDPRLPVDLLLDRSADVLDMLALLPVDRTVLLTAGASTEPAVRTLDAIHVAAAIEVTPTDGFVSYDERQAAAARLAGLRTIAPGAGRGRDGVIGPRGPRSSA